MGEDMMTPTSARPERARRWGALVPVGLAVAAVAPGCGGLLPSAEPNVRVVIVNEGSRPAVLDLVEYDFDTNESGDSLGWDMVPLDVGGTSTADLSLPTAGSWALTINGLVAIASINFAGATQDMPGTGALGYYITVFDDALETSVSRGEPLDGQTMAPEGAPP